MGYFSNPNFMYIQDYPYNSKEIDNLLLERIKMVKLRWFMVTKNMLLKKR